MTLQDRVMDRRGGLPAKIVKTTRSVRDLIELVGKKHPKLTRRKSSELLGIARSSVSDQAVPEDLEDIRIKRLLGNR